MKKVQILLSTFNGENYLKDQLDSILNQDQEDLSILIRDDGSTDNTILIIQQYAELYKQITYYQGENIGVINSFFDLIKNADLTADYYALSDQDDIWLPDKISSAILHLEKRKQQDKKKPLLYCGRTILVDDELNKINATIKPTKITPNFGNALVENICTGCTSVFNSELLRLVKEHIPSYTVMHDWWLYLTASAYGEVYYDEEPHILYRQHQGNVIGAKSNYYNEFLMRLRRFKGNRGNISRQAREFHRLYQTNGEIAKLLEYIINARSKYRYRIKIIAGKKIYRQRKIDNLIFKLLFLLGNV